MVSCLQHAAPATASAARPPLHGGRGQSRTGTLTPQEPGDRRADRPPRPARNRTHGEPQRHPHHLPRLLRQGGAPGRAVLAAGAAQRPDADVHELRHGAVQERLHRARAPRLRARRHQPEMRARRRQAQRPRQRRLHRPPPHLLRDARQLLVRRLLQGTGDPLRLGALDPRLRPAEGAAPRHRLPRRRRGGRALEEGRGPPRRAHHPHRHLRQFLDDGPDRPLRPVLGDLLRPRPGDPRWPAGQPRRGRRPVRRDLEPRLHAVRAARGRVAATRCPAPRSTPAWGSSASARCCRASTTTSTPT